MRASLITSSVVRRGERPGAGWAVVTGSCVRSRPPYTGPLAISHARSVATSRSPRISTPTLSTSWMARNWFGKAAWVMAGRPFSAAVPGVIETWPAPPGAAVLTPVTLLPGAPGVSAVRVITPCDAVQAARNAFGPATAVEALIACAKSAAVWPTLPLSDIASV